MHGMTERTDLILLEFNVFDKIIIQENRNSAVYIPLLNNWSCSKLLQAEPLTAFPL